MLFATDGNPIPEHAESGYLEAADGVRLRYAYWRPASGQTRGTVCVFHGRREFIEKYFEVVGDLTSRGFAVAMMDWRGQGGSDRLLKNPHKGHVRSFADYDRDLIRFMQDVVLPDCPPPYFALAHSMGGNVILRALGESSWFDRVVCVAPMVSLRAAFLPWSVAEPLVTATSLLGGGRFYIPGGGDKALENLPFRNNPLTGDRRRFERTQAILAAHPQLAIGSPTIGWVAAALKAMAALQSAEFNTDIKVPVLIAVAAFDRVVSNIAIGELANRLPAGGNVFLDEAHHEILMERDIIREQFWAAFDAFVPGTVVPHQALRRSNAFW
jgi:lysophospholipase